MNKIKIINKSEKRERIFTLNYNGSTFKAKLIYDSGFTLRDTIICDDEGNEIDWRSETYKLLNSFLENSSLTYNEQGFEGSI